MEVYGTIITAFIRFIRFAGGSQRCLIINRHNAVACALYNIHHTADIKRISLAGGIDNIHLLHIVDAINIYCIAFNYGIFAHHNQAGSTHLLMSYTSPHAHFARLIQSTIFAPLTGKGNCIGTRFRFYTGIAISFNGCFFAN